MKRRFFCIVVTLMCISLVSCGKTGAENEVEINKPLESENSEVVRVMGENASEEDIEVILSRDIFEMVDAESEMHNMVYETLVNSGADEKVLSYKFGDLINESYFNMEEVTWKYSYLETDICAVTFIGTDLIKNVHWDIGFLWNVDVKTPIIIRMVYGTEAGTAEIASAMFTNMGMDEDSAFGFTDIYSSTIFSAALTNNQSQLLTIEEFDKESDVVEGQMGHTGSDLDSEWNYTEFAPAPFVAEDFWNLQEVDAGWYDNGIFSTYMSMAYPNDTWTYVASIYPVMTNNPYDYSGFEVYTHQCEETQQVYRYLVPITPAFAPEVYIYDANANSMKLVFSNGELFE